METRSPTLKWARTSFVAMAGPPFVALPRVRAKNPLQVIIHDVVKRGGESIARRLPSLDYRERQCGRNSAAERARPLVDRPCFSTLGGVPGGSTWVRLPRARRR